MVTPAPRLVDADAEPQSYSLGTTGLKQWDGRIHEEFLARLRGRRGYEAIREMVDNSSVVGTIQVVIDRLVRQVTWSTKPSDERDRVAVEQAEFIESCFSDMSTSWDEFISEVFSFLPFGWSYHEICYKQRRGEAPGGLNSKHNDGLFGWRKLAPRGQDTLEKWEFDEYDSLRGLHQRDYQSGACYFVPIEKALLFRTQVIKGNPEGKPLTLDTLIPTPSGWTTMGEIRVGQQVFDESGKARYVTHKSEVYRDRAVYELEFSTGHCVRADASHLWTVTTGNDRTNGKSRTITTEEMFAAQSKVPQTYSCGVAPALDGIEQVFLVDPYVLGYWLGNGKTTGADFSAADEDSPFIVKQFVDAGYRVRRFSGCSHGVAGGLRTALRALGVLGDKHIPAVYLRSSAEQRLALLQGLMDSDGHSPGPDANDLASVFSNTNLTLVHQTAELIRTLGGRPSVKICRQRAGHLGGKIGDHQIIARRDLHELRFSLHLPVHRLPRKKEAQNQRATPRTTEHYIKAIRRVENADTQCVEVDSPSHLFLVGEGMVPTHNSIYRSALVDYFFLKRIQELEAIGFEKDMTGIHVMQVPVQMLSNNATPAESSLVDQLEKMMGSLKRGEREYAIVPNELDRDAKPTGFKFALLAAGGQRQFNTVEIKRDYRVSILQTAMAQFLALGTPGAAGNRALSVSSIDIFAVALKTYVDEVASVLTRHAVPRLLRMNNMDLTKAPSITHGDVVAPSLDDIVKIVLSLSQAQQLMPDSRAITNAILERASLPTIEGDAPATALTPDGQKMLDALGAGEPKVPLGEIPPPEPALPTDAPPAILNGAQIQAMLEILRAIKTGEIPRSNGVAFARALGLTDAEGDRLIGEVGRTVAPAP